jgi:IgA Peptidase M64/PEP-CTERM motif
MLPLGLVESLTGLPPRGGIRTTVMRTCTSFLLLLSLGVLFNSTASSTPITLINNGPSSNRVDIVFLGDGYTNTEINSGTYGSHVDSYINYMFGPGLNQEPFHRYRNYFDVHRIDVVSNHSGADVPPLGIFRDTALDASYYFDGVTERLLYINESKANAALNADLAGTSFTAEMRFVTINDTRYGGGGGNFAVYVGGNAASNEIALHEVGHSFSRLADEYGGNPQLYTGPEPVEINVTKDPSGTKWSHWLGYNQPGIGVIAAYEGARYHDQGLYRPSTDSKMRSLNQPFDAISREKILLDIYALTDPLDGWLENSGVLTNPALLTVDTIDPNIISVEWFVNSVLVPAAVGETFDPRKFGYSPGEYTVTARAFDPTGFDPINGWVRTNTSSLEQTVSWTIRVAAVPEPSTLALIGIAACMGLITAAARQRRRVSCTSC